MRITLVLSRSVYGPTKKARSCSDGRHMMAAWKLIYRALNVCVARYINVNGQAQKGHVTSDLRKLTFLLSTELRPDVGEERLACQTTTKALRIIGLV